MLPSVIKNLLSRRRRKAKRIRQGAAWQRGRGLLYEPLEDRRMLALALHVDDDSMVSSPDGLNWDSAYGDLQDALAATVARNSDGDSANDVAEIRIAGGTYRPSSRLQAADARSAAFALVDGVALVGGFAGLEAAGADRDNRAIETWVTVLSGDLGTPDVNSDNAYTVVYAAGLTRETTLDGVTVTGGNANGSADSEHPEWRRGGGVYAGSSTRVTITNSRFEENTAADHGGGIYGDRANLTLWGSVIASNSARWGAGSSTNAAH